MMSAAPNPIPPGFRGQTIFAGYTYFGQFIDHDLTWDQTPLGQAGELRPYQTTNHRTPWLDLDHLYGGGPESPRHCHLYARDNSSFKLGGEKLPNGEQFDVPLNDDGNQQLVDPRNNANLIIRQVHAMFLKLHNIAVKELPQKLSPRERFNRARDRVRWQYQWLVRNDFLQQVCNPASHEAVLAGRYLIDWDQDGFSIPVEFAQAAFRFGHSMVRAKYILNPAFSSESVPPREPPSELPEEVDLNTIFAEAHNHRSISTRRAINWRKFLTDPIAPQRSRGIDTGIVDVLMTPETPHEIPVRTLLRGAATQLATGEKVSDILGIPIPQITPAEAAAYNIPPFSPPWQKLIASGFEGKTPLWYYFLLEAQLEEHGLRLGSAGSRIVAETIEGSLRADRDSFLSRAGSQWTPAPWTGPDGEPIAIKTLFDVAVITGLVTEP